MSLSKLKISGTIKILLGSVLIILIIFTRFYNLDSSGTFFWDQALDLSKIFQYFNDREITLIGPISEDGSKVYGSLTYYMFMPFAVLGKFDPLSTAIGAAFWGVLTALLTIIMTKLVNKKMLLLVAMLMTVWFPLIETSRFAWNPNLVPFWIALGLILYQYKKPIFFFFSGLFFGMSLHNHYLAALSIGMFLFLTMILAIKQKTFRLHIYLIFGLIIAILPFIIFDLLHPPGLFLTRALYFNQTQIEPNLVAFLLRTWNNFTSIIFYYTHSLLFGLSVGVLIFLILFDDLKNKSYSLIYFIPWIFQIISISFINYSFTHYFLPGIIFFLCWIIYPREKLGKWLSKSVLVLLIISSLFTIVPQLQTNPYINKEWQPNIKTVREISLTMENTIQTKNLKNVNVAVLGSQDTNTYGWKYRNLLSIHHIYLKNKYEYFTSDHLFVVSQSTENIVRKDPAPEMSKFRNGLLIGNWTIDNSGWILYLFNKESNI